MNKFQNVLKSILPASEWNELLKSKEFCALYQKLETVDQFDRIIQLATNITIGKIIRKPMG